MATINEALWDLRELYRAEPNPARRQALQDAYDQGLNAVLEMTDKDIGNNTERYNKAIDGLEKSIADLKEAKRQVDGVAKAITNVAKAIDKLVEVVGKIVAF